MKKLLLFVAVILLASKFANAELPMQQSFSPLVKKTKSAVVNIYTKRVVQERMRAISPFFNDPFFNQFFNSPSFGGGVRERVEKSLGSGVIIEKEGLIATNFHVIKDATEINVITSEGVEFEAKKVLADERTDMAVLKIDTKGQDLPVVTLADSDAVEVGDIVLAIGNPFGVGQTVTSGIVSAVARSDAGLADYSSFIQTDAAINPGNSGGALIDMKGELIGINTAIYSRDGGSLGIGFAIPSNMLKSVIRAAKNGGKMVRPWVGLTGQAISPEMIDALGLKKVQGTLIQNVYAKSPAERAGIKAGDVVLSINGHEINDPEALKFRLATVELGSNIEMDVLRKGEKLAVEMKAEAPPENPPRDETLVKGVNPLSGAVVANISPALMDEIGYLEKDSGVVVIAIKGGNAASLGIAKGDIVLSVNNNKVAMVDDLAKTLGKDSIRAWDMIIQRGGKQIRLTISR